MMDLTPLIGNETIKTVLQNGSHAQTVLIEGDPGSGRHVLAGILTAAAVCHSDKDVPCGKCEACRKLAANMHTDVISVPSDCKTEELRQFLETVDMFPNEGRKKVYLIDNAEKLGMTQQNVLLKTLEEPPEYALFILICTTRESLLETVRSRCLILTTEPLSDDQIRTELIRRFGNDEPERTEQAIRQCRGRLGLAIELYQSKDSATDEKCREILTAFTQEDYTEMIRILSLTKDRNEFRQLLSRLREKINDLLLGHILPDVAKTSQIEKEKWARISEMLAQTEEKAALNVNLSLWSVAVAKACYEINHPERISGENRRE